MTIIKEKGELFPFICPDCRGFNDCEYCEDGLCLCPNCDKEKIDKFENEMKVEEDPSTWAHTLKEHWNTFTEFAWRGFSAFEEETRKLGHENKVDKMKWREYLLWDMQRRHNEEINGMDQR